MAKKKATSIGVAEHSESVDAELAAALEADEAEGVEEVHTSTDLDVDVVMREPVEDFASVETVERPTLELEGLPDLVRDQGGNVLLYGPFSRYREVTTEFGLYGVPEGLLLGFQIRDHWIRKEGRLSKEPFPVYWRAKTGEHVLGSGLPKAAFKKPGRRGG